MPYNVRFDFARPLSQRVVDIYYVSPPICEVFYYSEVPSSSESEGSVL